MNEAFRMHARPGPGAVHQLDAFLLQNAGADAAEHMPCAPALEDDRVYTGQLQQAPQHQSCRSRADDDDLCAQLRLPFGNNAEFAPADEWTGRA